MTTDAPQPNGSAPETISTPTPTTPTIDPNASLISQPPAAPAAPAFEPLTAEAIKLPEGFTLDNDSMTSFLGVMNNQALTPAQRAQELVNLQVALSAKSSEMGSQAWKDQQAAWQDEVYKDPTLGGANFETTVSNVRGLVDRFGDDNIRAAFDATGAGNNPHVVRFLNTLATQLKEASPTPPGGPSAGQARTAAERIYGNS